MIVYTKITTGVFDLCCHAARKGKPCPVFVLHNRKRTALITTEMVGAAENFHSAIILGSSSAFNPNDFADNLPEWVFTALLMACGMRLGFEEIERIQGWPARSAKLVVSIGLSEIIKRGVV